MDIMKIICVSGKRCAGKDYFADLLSQDINYKVYRLADEVKREYALCNDKDFNRLMYDREYKEKYRAGIIELGTKERAKDSFVWCKKLDEQLCCTDCSGAIIADVRYPNEMEYFKSKYNVTTVRIIADDGTRKLRGWKENPEIDNSETEVLLDDYEHDFIINNSTSETNMFLWQNKNYIKIIRIFSYNKKIKNG